MGFEEFHCRLLPDGKFLTDSIPIDAFSLLTVSPSLCFGYCKAQESKVREARPKQNLREIASNCRGVWPKSKPHVLRVQLPGLALSSPRSLKRDA